MCDPLPLFRMTERERGWCGASAGVKIIDTICSDAAAAALSIVCNILISMKNTELSGV
jgi:hypothetical protein